MRYTFRSSLRPRYMRINIRRVTAGVIVGSLAIAALFLSLLSH